MTNMELLLGFERKLRTLIDEGGKVDMKAITGVTNNYIDMIISDQPMLTPIKKFIFVEDGSVDTDELTELLELSNPEIKVVVYRQGARPPELVEVDDET